jgi:hypothetical protein
MVRYQIPTAYMPGLKSLLSFPQEEVKPLAAFIEEIEVGTGPQRFASSFEDKFKSSKGYDRNLAVTIYGLGGFRLNQKENYSNEEIAGSITSSFVAQSAPRKDVFTPDQSAQLSANLLILLNASNKLNLTFKAFSLQSENEIVFRDNHIVTDIRPLFNEDLEDNHRHGLIVHHLKVNAEINGDQKEFYFSMTVNDLHKLQEQILRAIEKDRLLRQDYQSNISFISITE